MPKETQTFKQNAIRPPEPIYLTADEITPKLFAGMRYVWICGYDSANYGCSYYYEFYHINLNIYLVDATDKKMMSKLRKVFPVIDTWQDNTLLKNTPWKVFTPDACLCIYVHKDIFSNMTPKQRKNDHIPMNDEAWSIICRLNRKEASFMYGAILGDIIGSPYEFDKGDKTKDFFLFSHKSKFTDDTVMTVAVADALMYAGSDADKEKVCSAVISSMRHWGKKYPRAGYGGKFREWLKDDNPIAYGSFGNGSAMRVSAAGWLYNSIERTREIARWTAEVTHNHIEGVKGAESVASAIYLARMGESKSFIKNYIEKEFGYNLSRSLDEIRPTYHMDETCQGSVPEAIIAFLESTDFEDAVRNAVSIGGDTDTIACIAGSIAEAYYGIETKYIEKCQHYILDEMHNVIRKFNKLIKRDAYGDETVIEAAIRRFTRNASSDDAEVREAILSRLKNNGDLLLSQGAVKFLNDYIENKDSAKIISIPAFTSLKEFTDWFVDLDADDWEGEDDTENLIVAHVSIREILEYISNASDKDDYIKLNQGAFYITPSMAKEILEEFSA